MTVICQPIVDQSNDLKSLKPSKQEFSMHLPTTSVMLDDQLHRDGSRGTSSLREQICFSRELSFLMEAHDGLSGAIAEQAGFRGVWASGLSISCALGYCDVNEVLWTQVVDAVERIVDSTELPVLVDGVCGFGFFFFVC